MPMEPLGFHSLELLGYFFELILERFGVVTSRYFTFTYQVSMVLLDVSPIAWLHRKESEIPRGSFGTPSILVY